MANNKKQHFNNTLILIFAIVATFYLMGRYVFSSLNSVQTSAAISMTVSDDISATGYFVRDEQIIPSGNSKTVEFVVKDGEKVFKGARLAIEYSDNIALELNRKINEIKSNVNLLTSVQENSGDFSDLSKLDQLIFFRMNELNNIVDNKNISGLSDLSYNLKELTLKRSVNGENISEVSEEIKRLETDYLNLQKTVKGKTNYIASPASGFFSETVDGFEEIFRVSELDKYTASTLENLSKKAPKLDNKNMGKIIRGFSWYFASSIPTKELGDLKKNQNVKLRFAQVSGEVPATVDDIRIDSQSGQALIIIKSMMMDEKLVSMRKQSVDIISRDYTGLKIPKEALRMVDGEMGVYVLNGTVSKFKTIKPMYEGDTFYIIEQSTGSVGNNNSVVAMDDIIIGARGIEDRKVVK